jgi:[ribosomal protein S5]-alanine N-acetyltransferase
MKVIQDFPIIKTGRFLLRKIESEDQGEIFRGLSHTDVIKYYGVSFSTYDATKEQMEWYAGLEKNNTGIWWAICNPDNSEFIGAVGLYYINQAHRKGEIGFWLLPEYWGLGIAAEVIPPVCNYGFKSLNLHRIESIVESENISCKKLMTKIGFDHEGTMKECEIKNGRFISLEVFAKFENRI